MSKFANKLRELRNENHLTQAELAKHIGVNKSAISFWELGVNEPKMSYLIALSIFFDISVDCLLGLTDEWGNPIAMPQTKRTSMLNEKEKREDVQVSKEEKYILKLYKQMNEEHRENIRETMELFARNSKTR